jgi:hypothetical protein
LALAYYNLCNFHQKYVPSQVLQQLMPRGFIMYGPSLERNLEVGRSLIQKAQITGELVEHLCISASDSIFCL